MLSARGLSGCFQQCHEPSVIVGAASRQAVTAVGIPSARKGEQGIESVRRLQGGAPSARALANSSPSAFNIYGKDQNN